MDLEDKYKIEDKNDETDIVLLAYADDLFRKQGSARAVA